MELRQKRERGVGLRRSAVPGAAGFRHGWIRGSSQGCLSLSSAFALPRGAHERVKASSGTSSLLLPASGTRRKDVLVPSSSSWGSALGPGSLPSRPREWQLQLAGPGSMLPSGMPREHGVPPRTEGEGCEWMRSGPPKRERVLSS